MTFGGPHLTYVGGPTLLIEWNGLRLLTDPTFDPGSTDYPTGAYTLHKTQSPALAPEQLGHLDAVLLSHDHHFDNLDHAGRDLVSRVERVLTTTAGAARLGPNARGLAPWDEIGLRAPDGRPLRISATPARHGPEHGDRGPVIGFVLAWDGDTPPTSGLYISGDSVWYEGMREVGERFRIGAAILFLGAAKVAAAGALPLTLTAVEGVEAARAFAPATVVPVHYEGWKHFSESRQDIEATFAAAGLSRRLQWLAAGQPTALRWPDSPPP